ncbi:hypothetical protein [Paenibacillus wynnii]|uniref:hypothetical protein n=1 Tax=Paenibacillus wynnii TaxID=268407 RepID=UPI002794F9AD|nr:hypothetical protein [Paenibacillus wynnii]MDQ0196201.1 hypothetical protein [Paenibacillus wynnii]
MNKTHFDEIPSVRLTAGMYALSKLACAGLTFLLLSLYVLWVPEIEGKPQGWPVTIPYAVYVYGLTASLAADALLRLLSHKTMVLSLTLYGLSGLGAGLWVAAEEGGVWLQCAVAGVLLLVIFYATEVITERTPLLLPVFALFAPLLYLLLM